MLNAPGVAARPGAGRPYERNIYPQNTPLNRSDELYSTSFRIIWKIHKNIYEFKKTYCLSQEAIMLDWTLLMLASNNHELSR